jgi:hypothetical protein
MKKFETIGIAILYGVAATAFIVVALAMMGCNATLDPSGPYSGDKFLYDIDGAIIDARQTLDGFLTWELQNRATLKAEGKQTVTAAADSIRTNAPTYFGMISTARTAYLNAKGPGTSNALFQSVQVIQTQTLTTKALTNFSKL